MGRKALDRTITGKSPRLDVRVPVATTELLVEVAAAQGLTRSEATRQAIEEWVEKQQRAARRQPRASA